MRHLKYLMGVVLVISVLGIVVAQTKPVALPGAVGSWRGDFGVKGVVIISIKSNHTWSQKNLSDPKDFDPKYDSGKWTMSVDLLTLNRSAKDAQPEKYTLMKDGNHLKPVDNGEITLIRQKQK